MDAECGLAAEGETRYRLVDAEEVAVVAVDLLDTDQRGIDLQGIGGAVEVAQFQTAPGAAQVDRSLIGADAGRTGAAGAVLQLDLGAIEEAVIGLAVGTDDDFGLKFELAVGTARHIVVVEAREELGITAEGYGDLRLRNRREQHTASKRGTGEKNTLHVSAPSKICYPVAAIEFITSAPVALLMRNIKKSKSSSIFVTF